MSNFQSGAVVLSVYVFHMCFLAFFFFGVITFSSSVVMDWEYFVIDVFGSILLFQLFCACNRFFNALNLYALMGGWFQLILFWLF